MNTLFGYEWADLQAAQQKQSTLGSKIDTAKPGDYGADPLGDGKFRMVPSGDIVDFDERCRRLAR